MENVLKENQKILKKLRKIGINQIKSFKEKTGVKMASLKYGFQNYRSTIQGLYVPSEIADAKNMIEEKSFFIVMIESFWSLFQAIKQSIKIPVIQLALRTQLEIAGNLIYFVAFPKKRKGIATEYWLLNIGRFFSLEENKNWKKIYESLIAELETKNSKNFYQNLKQSEFPLKKISKRANRLFPSPAIKGIYSKTQNLWGGIDRKKVFRSYSFLSTLTHGNIFLINNLKEENSKEHLFRSFLACFLSGERTIRTFKKFDKLAKFDSEKIQSLSEDFRKLLPKLYMFSKK